MAISDPGSAIARIFHALDSGDRDTFLDCWEADVEMEFVPYGRDLVSFTGRDFMVAMAARAFDGSPNDLRHAVGSLMVDTVGPDDARAPYYCTYIRTGDPARLGGIGRYEDRLIRRDGTWRVAQRRLEFLSPLV